MVLPRVLLLLVLAMPVLAVRADAATLLADYTFDNSLESSVPGRPAIQNIGSDNSFAVESVRGVANRVLTFPRGSGLYLPTRQFPEFASDDQANYRSYSLVVDFRLAEVNTYRRVLNWGDVDGSASTFTPDDGLYVRDGKLNFFVGATGGSSPGANVPFEPNKYVQVAFARAVSTGGGAPSGETRIYANGVFELVSYAWPAGSLVNELRLFTDNGAEESAGAITRIRFYEGVLTPSEVAAIYDNADPSVDPDGDGVYEDDNCASAANPGQADHDQDGQGDACDDSDGDGVLDAADSCPSVSNLGDTDADSDGQGNACDADDDNDGVADESDSCPLVSNPGDASGEACAGDADGDGVPDQADKCPTASDPDQDDRDGDGQGDACDSDDDGDGVLDTSDGCPTLVGPNGCPGAAVEKVGKVRTRKAGKRGIRLVTGIEANCPPTPVACPLKASVALTKTQGSATAVRRLGRVVRTMKAGTEEVVKIKLTKRGAKALRKAGKAKVKIKVSATGADGVTDTSKRRAKISPPS